MSNDLAASVDVVDTVIGGNPPQLTVPTFTELALYGSFDSMTGVSAFDVEDGNITSLVNIEGFVNMAMAEPMFSSIV